jgi:enoyl-CoA hydratase/carnithine racemase
VWTPEAVGLRATVDAAGVVTVELDRPDKKNALTFEIYGAMTQLFRDLERDPAVRAVVITGAGGEFCSGGDVREIISPLLEMDTPDLYRFTRMTCDLIAAIRALTRPVISAIDGVAVGAGAMIALASDLRVASERARIGFVFVKVGLCGADMGAAFLLPRVVGLGRASELLMFGDLIDAAEAYRIGLANRVVPVGQERSVAQGMAERLAQGPAFGLAMTKRALDDELGMDLSAALEAEARTQALCMETAEFREGHDAFVERRRPDFRRPRH